MIEPQRSKLSPMHPTSGRSRRAFWPRRWRAVVAGAAVAAVALAVPIVNAEQRSGQRPIEIHTGGTSPAPPVPSTELRSETPTTADSEPVFTTARRRPPTTPTSGPKATAPTTTTVTMTPPAAPPTSATSTTTTAPAAPAPAFSNDRGFGHDGLWRGLRGRAEALLAEPDGGSLVGGTAWLDGNLDAVVVRLRRDGTTDPGFGAGGIVRLRGAGRQSADALDRQADGKVLVAGALGPAGEGGIVRLLPDGSIDRAFGQSGYVATRQLVTTDMVVQPDGRIVTIGAVLYSPEAGEGMVISRFLPDGSPDQSFGGGGATSSISGSYGDPPTYERALAVTLFEDGRFLVVGRRSPVRDDCCGESKTKFWGFTSRGSFDNGFAGVGELCSCWTSGPGVQPSYGDEEAAVAVLAGAGDRAVIGVRVRDGEQGIKRLRRDGTVDRQFGDSGSLRMPGLLEDMAFDGQGRIVVLHGGPSFSLGRYTADGAADLGAFSRDVSLTGDEVARTILVQPDGRVVYAGASPMAAGAVGADGGPATEWIVGAVRPR